MSKKSYLCGMMMAHTKAGVEVAVRFGLVLLYGNTYQVHQKLNFKNAAFKWDGTAWMREISADEAKEPAAWAEWLDACVSAGKWLPTPRRQITAVAMEFWTPEGIRLMPHQAEAASRIYAVWKEAPETGFLLADAPRVGKTYTALAFAKAANVPVLVLSPASVVGMWKRQLALWGVEGEVLSYEKFRRTEDKAALTSVRIIILDEAHKVKNPTAQITKAVRAFRQKRFVLAMTGTPFQNSPVELASIVRITGYADSVIMQAADVDKWGKHYWVSSRLPYVRRWLTEADWYLRRELKDVAAVMPRLVREGVEAEGALWGKAIKEIERTLCELREQYEAQGKTAQAEKVTAVLRGVFGEEDLGALFPVMSTLRSLIARAKVGFAVEFVQDILESTDEPLLIFAHHSEVIEALAAALSKAGEPFGVITGETPQQRRTQLADAFQSGQLRVLVLSTRAAGEGLTLSRAARAIFVELDWNPAVLTQAENRLMNVANPEPKLVQYIIAPHALERRMLELVREKARAAERVYAEAGSIAKI